MELISHAGSILKAQDCPIKLSNVYAVVRGPLDRKRAMWQFVQQAVRPGLAYFYELFPISRRIILMMMILFQSVSERQLILFVLRAFFTLNMASNFLSAIVTRLRVGKCLESGAVFLFRGWLLMRNSINWRNISPYKLLHLMEKHATFKHLWNC